MPQETEEQQRKLIREAVHETLVGVGFHLQDPSQLQADMLYLRKLRHGSEDMSRVLRTSAITISFSTSLYLLWEAVKSLLNK